MASDVDPEIEALSKVCNALAALESDDVQRRVLDFAYVKFGLKGPKQETTTETGDSGSEDVGDDFLAQFEHKKPAENVNLVIAKLYSQYGTQPFSTSEIKALADGAGLVIPARIDMTLKGAGKKGSGSIRT